jgi:hypothetical protein
MQQAAEDGSAATADADDQKGPPGRWRVARPCRLQGVTDRHRELIHRTMPPKTLGSNATRRSPNIRRKCRHRTCRGAGRQLRRSRPDCASQRNRQPSASAKRRLAEALTFRLSSLRIDKCRAGVVRVTCGPVNTASCIWAADTVGYQRFKNQQGTALKKPS